MYEAPVARGDHCTCSDIPRSDCCYCGYEYRREAQRMGEPAPWPFIEQAHRRNGARVRHFCAWLMLGLAIGTLIAYVAVPALARWLS